MTEARMFAGVSTPALVLDRAKLDANIRRMQAHLRPLGIPLRPHLKTAKCVEIARLATAGEPGGLTVSTLAEARLFHANGFRDLLYAVGIAPAKLPQVAALHAQGCALTVILDHPDTAAAVAAFALAQGVVIPTLIEIDCDGHRGGLAIDDDAIDAAARSLDAVGAFRGVLTHAGSSYQCDGAAALQRMAERERQAIVAVAQRLEAQGLLCPVRSAGSTPTALFASSGAGLSEMRAGTFVFQDLFMAGVGVCTVEDIALSVLVSVIGVRSDRRGVIIDGGWTALSRDRGTAAQAIDQGYGIVCDADGAPIENVLVTATSQEHGTVARRDGGPVDPADYPIGRLLRILPNHACATAAQHRAYHVVEGDRIAGTWRRLGAGEEA